MAGISTLLHNFYNGIEDILRRVVQHRELNVPDGDSWHRDLVNLAASENLISASTADALKPYLAFRHFFVHAYAVDLQANRLKPLCEEVRMVVDSFREDIEQLLSREDPESPAAV